MIDSKESSRCNAMEILNLTKRYKDGNVLAINNISFNVQEGEIFSFLGPNGAGKSTTINIAATSLLPTSGSVKIFGKDILTETKEVRKHIGICPQELIFYENLTVYENLIFFGKMHNMSLDALKENSDSLINQVGLDDKKDTYANKLSGGMKRRLNLIIALVNEPDLIFLDEPTAGLDPQTRRKIWEFFLNLKEKGKTLFLTTHYMDEADYLSDNVAIIDYGKIIALDSPFDLKRQFSGGDFLEFKFKEADKVVNKKINGLKISSAFNELKYIKDDNLFRIAIHKGFQGIAGVLNQLQELGLNIQDMNIKANSLENVFIHLTGKNLRD